MDQLPPGTVALANNVYKLPSIREGVWFTHTVCRYPVKSTWLKAIHNNHYVGWSLLNVTNVHRYYPETVETPRGHLNQTPANVRSSKPKLAPFKEASAGEFAKAFNKKEGDVFIKIWDVEETVHSNQTGKFRVQSQKRNNYIMIMTHIDSSAVRAELMENCSTKEMIKAYCALLAKLRRVEALPDNECSADLKEVIREIYKLQLMPPGNYRINLADASSKHSNSTSWASLLARLLTSLGCIGMWSCLRHCCNWTCSVNQTPRQMSWRMPIYANSATIMPCHCCQSGHQLKYTSRWATVSLGVFILNQRGISTPPKIITVHIWT